MKRKFEITAEEILKDEEERGKELRRLRSEVDTFRSTNHTVEHMSL
jgi:hypothetical protein